MTVILTGLLSAIVGALSALVFTEWREARQRVREKSGLARLLLAEMERNSPDRDSPTVVVEQAEDRKGVRQEVVYVYVENPPMLEAWREARARLAQLLGPQDFVALANYYLILQKLTDNAAPYGIRLGEKVRSQVWPSEEQSWKELTEDLQSRLRRYANPPPRVRWLGF